MLKSGIDGFSGVLNIVETGLHTPINSQQICLYKERYKRVYLLS
jgi:hypothetical protein